MEKVEYNVFSGQPLYVPNPRYLELVETLLNRKLSHEDDAPLPHITIHNLDNYARPLPGDLTNKTDQEIAATLCRILGNVPPSWNELGEDERCPWLENAIAKRDGESRRAALAQDGMGEAEQQTEPKPTGMTVSEAADRLERLRSQGTQWTSYSKLASFC